MIPERVGAGLGLRRVGTLASPLVGNTTFQMTRRMKVEKGGDASVALGGVATSPPIVGGTQI